MIKKGLKKRWEKVSEIRDNKNEKIKREEEIKMTILLSNCSLYPGVGEGKNEDKDDNKGLKKKKKRYTKTEVLFVVSGVVEE